MLFTNFATCPGTLLTTTTPRVQVSRRERRHLFKLDSGEFALVASWETAGDWGCWRRVYSIHNRIGSHQTIEQALARFDSWIASD